MVAVVNPSLFDSPVSVVKLVTSGTVGGDWSRPAMVNGGARTQSGIRVRREHPNLVLPTRLRHLEVQLRCCCCRPTRYACH